jgi:hypothetical protein
MRDLLALFKDFVTLVKAARDAVVAVVLIRLRALTRSRTLLSVGAGAIAVASLLVIFLVFAPAAGPPPLPGNQRSPLAARLSEPPPTLSATSTPRRSPATPEEPEPRRVRDALPMESPRVPPTRQAPPRVEQPEERQTTRAPRPRPEPSESERPSPPGEEQERPEEPRQPEQPPPPSAPPPADPPPSSAPPRQACEGLGLRLDPLLELCLFG